MIAPILDNGITTENPDSLNRKIRIGNLIALLTAVVMFCYTPVYFYYHEPAGIFNNSFFFVASLITFFLIRWKKYEQAFFFHICCGFIYFIEGTLTYGLQTNLHFYLFIMCMISAVMFDKRKTIQGFIAFAVVSFFGLTTWLHFHKPFITVLEQSETVQAIIGNVNLFLLFIIASLIILFFKEEMLKSQKRITEQKNLIEEKNKDILDSMHYAQRIQSALLPSKNNMQLLFPSSFLYFQPKDIVSGDFYWIFQNEDYRFVAVGDCTGHGVPGALMSVLGINLLHEIVENKRVFSPAEILNELRSGIIAAFDKEGKSSEYKDGMDISILRIDRKATKYVFAAANNSVYHISGHVLEERAANRQPVGYSHDLKPFTQQEFSCQSGDLLVLFTDGFADQFGGPKNKKFRYKPFKELLLENTEKNMETILSARFEAWKGSLEQIDDVCVLGIRL
ncbi:PP2C family protein-serine/threonine phosphatase [Fluviicola chungangensis]|uniref:SpoIIE family protein phosphatase n=1 Tax=Fluviicola chungangensis TaxID=2597671 RepID=A0A556N343_9FLAO|nr:SpoIIE family protein phosphatase [Fluviicola chungangensis]TSJ46620.1 SpoIIE family protein phosphatase [Fluviicola chungangensis]